MPRRSLVLLIAVGTVLFTSCSMSTVSHPPTTSVPRGGTGGSSTPSGGSSGIVLTNGVRLFAAYGTWVAPRSGLYTVVAVGGGGGGGGGGSAPVSGGPGLEAGGAGGAGGGVTINDVVARKGGHFAISVGKGGVGGTGGAPGGGSGLRGVGLVEIIGPLP